MTKSDKRALKESSIIDMAEKVFASKGYENTKMEDIASELGISKGTIYFYFNSKEISAEELKIALTIALKDNPDSSIILKSDNQLEVQKLISVMDLIKESGGVSISIATKIEATKGS